MRKFIILDSNNSPIWEGVEFSCYAVCIINCKTHTVGIYKSINDLFEDQVKNHNCRLQFI